MISVLCVQKIYPILIRRRSNSLKRLRFSLENVFSQPVLAPKRHLYSRTAAWFPRAVTPRPHRFIAWPFRPTVASRSPHLHHGDDAVSSIKNFTASTSWLARLTARRDVCPSGHVRHVKISPGEARCTNPIWGGSHVFTATILSPHAPPLVLVRPAVTSSASPPLQDKVA